MAGLTDRDQAKTFIYAFMYGAGASEKIGKIVGAGNREHEQVNKWTGSLSNMPDLKRVQREMGWIRGSKKEPLR